MPQKIGKNILTFRKWKMEFTTDNKMGQKASAFRVELLLILSCQMRRKYCGNLSVMCRK